MQSTERRQVLLPLARYRQDASCWLSLGKVYLACSPAAVASLRPFQLASSGSNLCGSRVGRRPSRYHAASQVRASTRALRKAAVGATRPFASIPEVVFVGCVVCFSAFGAVRDIVGLRTGCFSLCDGGSEHNQSTYPRGPSSLAACRRKACPGVLTSHGTCRSYRTRCLGGRYWTRWRLQ